MERVTGVDGRDEVPDVDRVEGAAEDAETHGSPGHGRRAPGGWIRPGREPPSPGPA